MFEGRIYVPPNAELRQEILQQHHDKTDVGHPGQHRMIELLKRTYWWPQMRNDVKRYIKGCDTCQRNKILRTRPTTHLHPLPIPTGPWEEISIDMIGPLPESDGYDAILVIVDRFSKMIRLRAVNTTLSSEELGDIYRDDIWRQHGIPRRIISDRGPQFASKFMAELCRATGTQRNLSTAYHPQTDGQTERINQEVEAYLRNVINHAQDNWKKWLSTAEFQYNDKTHSATGHSPFQIVYGRHPWKGDISNTVKAPAITERIQELQDMRQETVKMLQQNQTQMEKRNSTKPEHEYKPGDQVWLEEDNIRTTRPTKKLDHRRYGPFQVEEKIGETSYRLELPETWAIHDVFNSRLLSPYHKPEYDSQRTPPPPMPEIINDEEHYEVDEVRGHRTRGKRKQYLIHWKGYTSEEDTWEDETNLENAKEAVQEFMSKISRTKPIKRGGKRQQL